MTRLFVSFYLFIAISLVLISSTLELLWPNESIVPTQESVMLENLLPYLAGNSENLVQGLEDSGIPYQFQPLSSVAWSADELAAFDAKHIVTLFDEKAKYLYVPVDNNQVLVLTLVEPLQSRSDLLVYLGASLLLLGLLLAAWLWPLWRDLSYLTRKVSSLDQDSSSYQIALKKRSVMQPIANKLNLLSERVHSLLRDQRELTGAVAHEFRTPIARLKFALEMHPEPNSQAWRGIQADLDELESLVQEMLDYTQYDAMTPELNIADIPVKELCWGVSQRLGQTTEKIIEVTGSDIVMKGDGHFIERAVSNLLTNAIRHAHSRIAVVVESHDDQVCIHVNDDGPGVDANQAKRIFDPFFRPDNSRVRYAGGAGLGLAIVQRIQLWHQGDAQVNRSTELGGARFTLSYPS